MAAIHLLLLQFIHSALQILVIDLIEPLGLYRLCKLRVNRHLTQHRKSQFFRDRVDTALPEYGDLFSAVRTLFDR